MARQIIIPGVGHYNETGTRVVMLPGAGHFSATVSATNTVSADGSASGTSTIAAVAAAFALTVAAATGVGTPAAAGASRNTTTASTTGTGTVTAVSATVSAAIFDEQCKPVLHGRSASVLPAIYGSTGTSTVTGDGQAALPSAGGDGASAGSGTVSGIGSVIINSVGISTGAASVLGVSEHITPPTGADGAAAGSSTVSGQITIVAIATSGSANGIAFADADSHVISGSDGSSHGGSLVDGVSPTSLVPLNFKPIEQRRVRFPKLPRGTDPWTSVATREFDSFFNDMHHHLANATFVSGVHTEILEDGFTITPETSVVFVMSADAVTSDIETAIKSTLTIPRLFIIVNTGLFPITFKDGANTIFGGNDKVLPSGQMMFLVYTGVAWVGNAI